VVGRVLGFLDRRRVTARGGRRVLVRSIGIDGSDGSVWGDPWGELSCHLIGCKSLCLFVFVFHTFSNYF
jgi:hypothetical protein